jgi:hypothetical protein
VRRLSVETGSNSTTNDPDGQPEERRHWLSRILRFGLRATPRRHRFRVALSCARQLAPLVQRTAYYRQQRKSLVDGPIDITLYLILAGLTRNGIAFAPRLRVSGFELFEAAVRLRRGVLLISGHNVFGFTILGYMAERGYKACQVSYTPDPHNLLAPDVAAPTITPGRSYLLEIRDRFRNGEVIGAMIDRAEAVGSRTFPIATAGGTLHLADALIEVAAHARASVIFLRASVGNDAIDIELSAPGSSTGDARSVARDFAQFLQGHIQRNAAP